MKNNYNSKIVCVVPAKDEETTIHRTISELVNLGFTVICVNDGSKDKTAQHAEDAGAVVVNHSYNLGQGASLETGFEVIRRNIVECEYVATFDADGQHVATDLLNFASALQDDPEIMIALGSRFITKTSKIPIIKYLLLRFAAMLSNLSGKIKLTDRHNGIRMFRKEFLENFEIKSSGYGHADEFLKSIVSQKLRYLEVPVTIIYTEYSKSKGQPLVNAIRLLFDKIVGL